MTVKVRQCQGKEYAARYARLGWWKQLLATGDSSIRAALTATPRDAMALGPYASKAWLLPVGRASHLCLGRLDVARMRVNETAHSHSRTES